MYDKRERNEPDEYRLVVRALDRKDYGPWGDDPWGGKSEHTAECPHCGAHGRYVWAFVTDDGQKHHAMEGCMQIWPGGKAAQSRWYKADKRRRNVLDSAPDLVDAYDEDMNVPDTVRDAFLRDVLDKGAKYGFSEKQAEAARRARERGNEYEARKQEKAAAGITVPTGKAIEVLAIVTSVKYRDDWDRWVMTVEGNEGWRMWGTLPAALATDNPSDAQGKAVSFVADVEASSDDPAFGFIRRPRKATFKETD
jgi:hypothetical protein